jgi:hypothetical protein
MLKDQPDITASHERSVHPQYILGQILLTGQVAIDPYFVQAILCMPLAMATVHNSLIVFLPDVVTDTRRYHTLYHYCGVFLIAVLRRNAFLLGRRAPTMKLNLAIISTTVRQAFDLCEVTFANPLFEPCFSMKVIQICVAGIWSVPHSVFRGSTFRR